jgi:hypothetical protein
VLAAAARLGYPGPNPLAAGLRRGRVGALGFAYDNPLSYAFDDPVAVAVLAGISAVAEQAGSGLLLVPGSAPAERNSAAVASAVIDGLVVFSVADDDPLLDVVLAAIFPLSLSTSRTVSSVRGPSAGGSTPWVGVDVPRRSSPVRRTCSRWVTGDSASSPSVWPAPGSSVWPTRKHSRQPPTPSPATGWPATAMRSSAPGRTGRR